MSLKGNNNHEKRKNLRLNVVYDHVLICYVSLKVSNSHNKQNNLWGEIVYGDGYKKWLKNLQKMVPYGKGFYL